jgi:hypothetical protein
LTNLTGSVATNFLHDGLDIIVVSDTGGNHVARYLRSLGIDEPWQRTDISAFNTVTNGLVAWWELDEGTGNPKDSGPNSFNNGAAFQSEALASRPGHPVGGEHTALRGTKGLSNKSATLCRFWQATVVGGSVFTWLGGTGVPASDMTKDARNHRQRRLCHHCIWNFRHYLGGFRQTTPGCFGRWAKEAPISEVKSPKTAELAVSGANR